MNFSVSVIVVTYNRPLSCKKTINSLLSQSILPYEIIVVDDASSKPFEFNHPLVKVFRNQFELGLSASRNIGVKVSKGDIVAFIDDDAIADRDWIKNIECAFREYDADIIGGPVFPLFLSKPPEWFDIKQFGGCIGINRKDEIIGCNFAVKRSVFERIGYFDENLGRKYGKLLSGEESEFLQRARYANLRVLFMPEIKVHHTIHPHRLTLYYLMRRVWWQGVTDYYYLFSLNVSPHKTILKISLKKMGSIALSIIRIFLSPKNRKRRLLRLILHMGFFSAILKRDI
ncbi:MAG: glycosyltransferase [Candidatus Bathyarchaeia archaeon]